MHLPAARVRSAVHLVSTSVSYCLPCRPHRSCLRRLCLNRHERSQVYRNHLSTSRFNLLTHVVALKNTLNPLCTACMSTLRSAHAVVLRKFLAWSGGEDAHASRGRKSNLNICTTP